MSPQLHAVTGAFGFTGRYITKRLLAADQRVLTLTSSVGRAHPFGAHVAIKPYTWNDQEALINAISGVDVLYNTYWVRFNHRTFKHSEAVENTLKLFAAAKAAGVRRVVHTSITNPSLDSPLEYFRGKAVLEMALKESGLSYAILRPAVLFGDEDILVNNIAWALRRLPVFGVFGRGRYRLQPMHVDDFAALAVAQGALMENATIDAIGPETFTYRELAAAIGEIIGKRRFILPVPPRLGWLTGWFLGKLVGDVMITWEEVRGLMADLLYTQSPPAGQTRLTDWAKANAAVIGTRYHSELARRRDRESSYDKL